MMNRLQNTVSNIAIQAENIQAAESQISDADIALEMTAFMNNQIKTQAAVAMLAQANMIPQLALRLIGG
jgi:flagellin